MQSTLPMSHRPGTKEPFSLKQKGPLRVLASGSSPTQKPNAFFSSSCTVSCPPHFPHTSFISHTMLLQRTSNVHSFWSYSEVPPPPLLTQHDLKQQLGSLAIDITFVHPVGTVPRALGRQDLGCSSTAVLQIKKRGSKRGFGLPKMVIKK